MRPASGEDGWFSLARGDLCGGGADKKSQNRKIVPLSPYVEEPLNSKIIKSFVPEQRSRQVFFVFRDSYVLSLWRFDVHFPYSCIWLWYRSSLVHFKIGPKYLPREADRVFIPLMRTLLCSLVSSSFLVLMGYSFLISFLLIILFIIGVLSDRKSPQVFKTLLSILADPINAVVWRMHQLQQISPSLSCSTVCFLLFSSKVQVFVQYFYFFFPLSISPCFHVISVSISCSKPLLFPLHPVIRLFSIVLYVEFLFCWKSLFSLYCWPGIFFKFPFFVNINFFEPLFIFRSIQSIMSLCISPSLVGQVGWEAGAAKYNDYISVEGVWHFHLSVKELCVMELFRDNRKGIGRHCQIEILLDVILPKAIKITDGVWAIASRDESELSQVCTGKSPKEIKISPPLTTLQVPLGCGVYGGAPFLPTKWRKRTRTPFPKESTGG